MKYLYIFFNILIISLFLCIFLSPAKTIASNQQDRTPKSYRERAMNAAQQLRKYNNKEAVAKHKSNSNTLNATPKGVSIKVDKSFKTSSTVFFHDDIESGIGGWTTTSYSGSDLFHQTTIDACSPTTSWWDGTEQQGNYNTGTQVNCALISLNINLAGAIGSIKLLFTEKYCTELGWDFCMVDVSTNGGSDWIHLRGGYGDSPSGDSEGWQITTLDLTSYAGQNIKIRFYFNTGDELFNEFPGWFIDDIMIFDQSGLITGKKFFDINQNGVKDIGERGIKEWLITATGTGNSAGLTLTARTNYRGRYWLPLPLGTYTLTEEHKNGWTQTSPISGQWDINFETPDTLIDSVHFGNWTQASFINGIKFNDLDSNGVKDPADTALIEWKIVLSDTNGTEIDFDRTDSLGQYQLYIFEPGRYVVSEITKKGWVQSYPSQGMYTINITDLGISVNDQDFGNYYSPSTNSIMGIKFNDRDRNHEFTAGDQLVAGVQIEVWRKGSGSNYYFYRKTKTDSSGFYQFLSLPPDTYKVLEVLPIGWYKSLPDSHYIVALEEGGTYDNLDFGNYEIVPGSIAGIKYDDENDSGTKEENEGGLSGWTIMISGTTIYNSPVLNWTITNQEGNYNLINLWPGSYTVSEVWRPSWRQTYPTGLKPHSITLGPEENLTGKDFGNIVDSTFVLSFRTFLPESIALSIDKKSKHKPIALKPDKCSWNTFWIKPIDPAINDSISKLKMRFTNPPIVGSITTTKACTVNYSITEPKIIEITLDSYLQPDDSIKISGFGKKPVLERTLWWQCIYADSIGTKRPADLIEQYNICLPMPNGINLLHAGAGTGLKVGLGSAHSVVHPTYKYVMKSLIEKYDRMHIGDPRCLATLSNERLIKRQQKSLTPTKHNNKLFAEAIALKANIAGSDLGILPQGLGNLIFNEGGDNPLNGLTIRGIAAKLDTAMSMVNDTFKICTYHSFDAPNVFDVFYNVVRKIDSAFSGPIDTESFAYGLRYKAVRPLADVPFLHLDSSLAFMGTIPIQPLNTYVPEQFALYQNYPNPFNPTTIIEFYLPEESFVTLKLYNILGQEIATLIDKQEMEDGPQEFELFASTLNLASGVYYYKLVAETVTDEDNTTSIKHTDVKKMVLLK